MNEEKKIRFKTKEEIEKSVSKKSILIILFLYGIFIIILGITLMFILFMMVQLIKKGLI